MFHHSVVGYRAIPPVPTDSMWMDMCQDVPYNAGVPCWSSGSTDKHEHGINVTAWNPGKCNAHELAESKIRARVRGNAHQDQS